MYDAAASARYRQRHPDRVRRFVENWRDKNKEYIREYERTRYANWPEETRARRIDQSNKWKKENKEKYLEYLRRWREENKDKIRVSRAADKNKRKLLGAFTKADIERIRKQQ